MMGGFEEDPMTFTWGCTSSAGWCIQFKLDKRSSSEGGGRDSRLLVSERGWSFTAQPGEGWTVSASSVFTVEQEGWTFCANVDKGHCSSMTPRARQAGVPRTTPSSPWTM